MMAWTEGLEARVRLARAGKIRPILETVAKLTAELEPWHGFTKAQVDDARDELAELAGHTLGHTLVIEVDRRNAPTAEELADLEELLDEAERPPAIWEGPAGGAVRESRNSRVRRLLDRMKDHAAREGATAHNTPFTQLEDVLRFLRSADLLIDDIQSLVDDEGGLGVAGVAATLYTKAAAAHTWITDALERVALCIADATLAPVHDDAVQETPSGGRRPVHNHARPLVGSSPRFVSLTDAHDHQTVYLRAASVDRVEDAREFPTGCWVFFRGGTQLRVLGTADEVREILEASSAGPERFLAELVDIYRESLGELDHGGGWFKPHDDEDDGEIPPAKA